MISPVSRDPVLLVAGVASGAAALAHLAAIVGGPSWYRAFGAGEEIASAAARGSFVPAILTLGIAAVLTAFALYAFAGAGVIGRLPKVRIVLVLISAVYLARGLVILKPSLLHRPDLSPAFIVWSSLIVLAMGLAYAIGTARAWHRL